jgi:hypothetical protein
VDFELVKELSEKQNWGIVGVGWLGQALSTFLHQQNIPHWGTTRSEFHWQHDLFPEQACDILFLNTPPLIEIAPKDYVEKIPVALNRRLFFISSISVYGSQRGIIDESTPPAPETASAKWLCEVENRLQEKWGHQLTIFRAGGLIGDLRHPIFQLAKSQRSIPGNSPINLIHRDDLIQIIYTIAKNSIFVPVVNAVCPFHPSKKEYYTLWSSQLKLPEPHFLDEAGDNKIISSEFLKELYPVWIHPKLDQL